MTAPDFEPLKEVWLSTGFADHQIDWHAAFVEKLNVLASVQGDSSTTIALREIVTPSCLRALEANVAALRLVGFSVTLGQVLEAICTLSDSDPIRCRLSDIFADAFAALCMQCLSHPKLSRLMEAVQAFQRQQDAGLPEDDPTVGHHQGVLGELTHYVQMWLIEQ